MLMRLLLVLVLFAAPLAGQKKPLTVEKLLALHRLSDPQVSPDGRTVLFSVMSPDLAQNVRPTQIWSVPLEGGEPKQWTRDGSRNTRARWSPDGRRIAFLSNRSGSQQIWLMDAGGADPRKLGDVPTEADGILWSPDGRNILFTSSVYPDCPDMACNKQRDAERSKSPVSAKIFEGLLYRHWNSWKDGKRSHLFVLPAAAGAGAPLDLTPGNHDVPPFSLGGPDQYAFSPDGREVAYVTNMDPVEAVSTNNDIFLVPATGGPPKKITVNPAWDGSPAFSPDGSYIAYLKMERAGYEADRFQVMLYERKSGRHSGLTEKFDRSAAFVVWSPDSRRIYFGADDRATHPIFVVNAAAAGEPRAGATGGDPKPVVTGGDPKPVVTGGSNDELSITADGRTLVFTRASLERPNEIFRAAADGLTAGPQPVTRLNDALLADTHIAKPEAFSFAGAGGTPVHGWLIKPPGFDPARKHAVMFLLHGGPQGSWGDAWSFRWNAQTFAAAGYLIVMVNRRGSTGFGQKFTDEINADWGGRAYEDIMKGVAHVAKMPFVDPARIGASGASYGGYMANWIAGHTGRFRCLVSHAGVFDLESMYGTTEELWFPEWEFGGAPWDNPEVYRRLSPGSYAKHFKTPTLVTHGQLDYRVDIGQGLAMYTALQKMKVPSKMLYFPDEGHWILKPANSAFWYRQVISWWDQWLR